VVADHESSRRISVGGLLPDAGLVPTFSGSASSYSLSATTLTIDNQDDGRQHHLLGRGYEQRQVRLDVGAEVAAM
jgi:hypothetical protein